MQEAPSCVRWRKISESENHPEHRIRVTLSSKNVKSVEKVAADLIKKAEERVTCKGPVRVPTKTLRITTRKTPCGEGSKTWDRYQMRIHKRYIDLISTTDVLKEITSITIEPDVDIEVTVSANAESL